MARRLPWVVAALIVVLLLLDVAVLTFNQGNPRATWRRLGDVAYVLPDDLPSGWAVAWAVERQGRPPDQWTSRSEVLATRDRRRFVVLSASKVDEPDRGAQPGFGQARDVSARSFGYLFARTVGVDPDPLKARAVSGLVGDLSISVTELGDAPDDALLSRAAGELGDSADLDFEIPEPLRKAGFESVGGAPLGPRDVTDYTIVWRPRDLIGADRAAGAAQKTGPVLSINVGGRFYGQARKLQSDPRSAPLERKEGRLRLEFTVDGSPVTVGAEEIDEEAMRAAATSLRTLGVEAWRKRLGPRLLLDPPS